IHSQLSLFLLLSCNSFFLLSFSSHSLLSHIYIILLYVTTSSIMTEEGKEKVENELHDLKTVKRKEVVERIKTARDCGDLSENSEYDSAKEEQAFVETRIAHLENMIRNAVIIENDDENKN